MNSAAFTRIVIADDSGLVRFSLNKLITSAGGFSIDCEASNGKELIDYLERAAVLPEICILDIGMPVMNGYEAIHVIKKNWPSIKIIVLSVYNHEYSVNYMLRKGANAFLSKDVAMSVIKQAVYSVATTGYYYSDVAPKEAFDDIKENPGRVFEISGKQRELLHNMFLGLSTKEIAEKMGIAKSTVEDYRNVLCNKLNLKNRSELIHFAIKNELV